MINVSNYDILNKAFDILLKPLATYIATALNSPLSDRFDIQECLRRFDNNWRNLFESRFPEKSRSVRSWINELKDIRNETAHRSYKDISFSDAERALDTMSRLSKAIGAEKEASILNKFKSNLQNGNEIFSNPKTVEAKSQRQEILKNASSQKSNIKGKISEHMVEVCYKYYKECLAGRLQLNDAVNKVVAETGMNRVSASRMIRDSISGLFAGEKYTSAMSKDATLWLLNAIRKEYGEKKFQNALNAVEKHLNYYEQLSTGSAQQKIRDFVNSHKK